MRGMKVGATLMICALSMLSKPNIAKAQLSPGDLTHAHASLEGLENCNRCHDRDQSKVGGKCLECHTPLRERIEQHTGFHGSQDLTDCTICHVEHQGRDYELVWWDGGIDAFDHAKTGYTLTGAHTKLKCRQCHTAAFIQDSTALLTAGKDLARTFLGLDTTCTSCHFDEHRGQLAQTCTNCHTTTQWKPAPGFDHDKTEFRLVGKHQSTPCAKCHATVMTGDMRDTSYVQFGGPKRERCIDCHEDVHKDRLGKLCQNCHTPDSWKTTKSKDFDHSKTRYPLEGKHATVGCEKCHPAGRAVTNTPFAKCTDCHRDYHKGEFADRAKKGACEACHTVNGFTPSLFSFADHDQTRYPLRGAHAAVICASCHSEKTSSGKTRAPRFAMGAKICEQCHRDIHDGTEGKAEVGSVCIHCHIEDLWTTVSFNHAATKFPLTGKHVDVECLKCHRPDSTATPRTIRFATKNHLCSDCHKDIHRGQFVAYAPDSVTVVGPLACDQCHTTNQWKADLFVHNRDARWQLDGAHSRVACNSCHHPVENSADGFILYRSEQFACRDCHSADSVLTTGGQR